jgi:hypothetical protein
VALITYNGTNYDSHLGSASIGGTNVNLSTTGITSLGCTAPNTSNKATGVWIAIGQVPNSPNTIRVDLQESGVVKATAYMNAADMTVGYNYARFTTPYQFTTTAANAYTVKLTNSSTNSGFVRTVTNPNLWYQLTYDATVSVGASDDVMVGGFHDSGLTSKTLTITGTGNSWGSGTNPSWTSTTLWDMASPLIIGNGGIVKYDTTANATLTVAGSVVVYRGGLFDMRPGASSVSTLIFNQGGGDGRFGLVSPTSGYGGQILTTGATVAVAAQYASGVGTAANPLVTQSAHGFVVGQELIIPGLTYNTNQYRFVIGTPTSTQLVLSATLGGAESAITNTPAVGSWIANTTRNSIIKSTTTAAGHFVYNSNTNTTPVSDFEWTRHEYANCASGRGLNFNGGSSNTTDGNDADFTGTVLYNNSAAGRNSITFYGKLPQTVTDIVLVNTKGTNFSAQSGLVFQSINKTATRVYNYAEPSSTTSAAGVSFATASVKNRLTNFHSYGANAANGSLGYALGLYGVNNVVENSTINATRVSAIRSETASATLTNCNFGLISNNTITITLASSTLNNIVFQNCYSSDTTLVSNYLNTIDGTDIAFQDLDGNTNKHRWYTNKGSFWSSGTGLTETTVRTAGSLALAIKPENSTDGAVLTYKIPCAPASEIVAQGYIYRNAAFSSGDIVVDLFLPGTLLTATPDATQTMSTTTLAWQDYEINKYYSGSVARYATVRITAKTATAGAFAFLDDLYDAQTLNKVAGLDLYDAGHISPIMVLTDFSSAVPVLASAARVAVWSDTDTYTTGQKGFVLAFIEKLAKFLVGKK